MLQTVKKSFNRHAREPRLGELLMEMGLIDREELRAMLSLQAELRRAHGDTASRVVAERFRLGCLLVDSGVIDERKLKEALTRSRRTGRTLSETLVEAGAVSAEALQRFLNRERRLTAAAVAGMALLTGAHGPVAASDRAQVQISATVLPRAYIERQRLPQQLVISEQDVARGYVEVHEPVEVNIRSNYPGGVVIGFAINSPYLSGLDVRASEGNTPLVAAATVFVPQRERGLRARSVSLKLRLKLAPHAVPGTIAFPVTVSLDPA